MDTSKKQVILLFPAIFSTMVSATGDGQVSDCAVARVRALIARLFILAGFLFPVIASAITLTGSGTLTAPGYNNHAYTFVNIDASQFTSGGKISISITLGNGVSSASYDLYQASYIPVTIGQPQNSLVNAYDVSPGSTTNLAYSFGPGSSNQFKLGLEGNWFSPAGSTNTYTYTIVITAAQSITFGSVPIVTVGGTGTVSASSTSGLAISFSSTTPSICTVSGNIVTGIAAGTCDIAANHPGNALYSAAS